VEKLRKDKQRLQVKNEDLRKYVPENYRPVHMEDNNLDGSFLDMKQRNVVEILDMKVRKLKKKNDLIMNQDVQNDFTNSKNINISEEFRLIFYS